MRTGLIALWMMLLCSITPAAAQVDVNVGLRGVSIGINVPVYPELVPVPGYPLYYAPHVNANYFFYDGRYWIYQNDNWYASYWYNGPWELVTPDAVPLFVLRIPVRYYRRPPEYFHGWRADAPPRWDEHWGNTWAQSHSGWDHWSGSVPPPAPLPAYQRQYSGNRYPNVQQQQVLQSQNYRYQPHNAVVQQHYQAPRAQGQLAPSAQGKQAAPQATSSPQANERVSSRQSSAQQGAVLAPRGQPPQEGSRDTQKTAAARALAKQGSQAASPQGQQPHRAVAQYQQQAPKSRDQNRAPQAKAPAPEPRQAQRQEAQLAAAQHQQPAPKPRVEEKAPEGKGPAQEPRQGQDKEH